MFILNMPWHARSNIFTSTAVVGGFKLYISKGYKTPESFNFEIEHEYITFILRVTSHVYSKDSFYF